MAKFCIGCSVCYKNKLRCLFHYFIPHFFDLKISFIPDEPIPCLGQSLRFIVLLLISMASWYLLEQPILNMTNRFPTS